MRKKCIVCNSPLHEEPIYICRDMPNEAQFLPSSEDLINDRPISFGIFQCSGCGLVQLNCEPVKYYRDSTRAGERCDALIALRREQYTHLIETYNLRGKKILEVGAGKGGFLKTLVEMEQYKISAVGIENNLEYVKIAREKEGVDVISGFLDDENMVIQGGPYDAFVSFAYPARLINPNTMLRCVYNNLCEGGIGLIQVPSLEHLLSTEGFYDITRDHIAYYDKNTLSFLMNKNGFDVLELGEVSYIYNYTIVRKRPFLNLQDVWKNVDILIDDIRDLLNREEKVNRKIAVWCAGHFAFTILSLGGKDFIEKVLYIIDNAPFKQGKFSPASHIPIFGPEHFKEEPVDTIIILGPLYVDEIVREIKEECGSRVKIITVDKYGMREIA